MKELPEQANCCMDPGPPLSYIGNVWISMTFSRNRTAILSVTWNAPHASHEIRLTGSSSSLLLQDFKPIEGQRDTMTETGNQKYFNRTHPDPYFKSNYLDEIAPSNDQQDPFRELCFNLSRQLLNKNESYAEQKRCLELIILAESLINPLHARHRDASLV